MSHDAVLLIAFGGPEKREDVRPFLDNVLRGRPVPRERYEDVVHHYELIGGRSPLNELTFAQRDGLAALLRREGPDLPVYVGMRNWRPYIAETLATMRDDGVRHALALILAPHRTEASVERYVSSVAAGLAALGEGAPRVDYTGPWFDHPRYIAAVAAQIRGALARENVRLDAARIVFTAHSIPVAMAQTSPYVDELGTSARLVAADLGVRSFAIAYQSRSGSPADPWLEPDVNAVLRALAGKDLLAVVVPIGFVCDHVEVLYDLDVEARATAEEAGVRMIRVPTVNDHPVFIRMLAEVVRRDLAPT